MIWMKMFVMGWILRELRAPTWVWILTALIALIRINENYKELKK